MIFTERKITVRKGKSSIDESVILYRGDYEVELRFTIMETKYRFKNGVNLIDSEKAAHAQLALLAPDGSNVFTEIGRCEDGTAIFVLSKEMIDELSEVGLYSFQIRLFDYYRESRVTIPPVEFGIEVREPIAAEDHINSVGDAMVGYSIAKTSVLDEPVPVTFDNNGQYNKTDWETGDRITEGRLNKIEDALDQINQNEIADTEALNKQMNSNYNVLSSTINTKASTGDLQALSNTVNKKADTTYVDNKVKAVASGSPKGVYATVAALTSAIPKGDSNIYVVNADGCWYYWNGSAWTKGGVYQDTQIADGTITTKMFSTDINNRMRASSNAIYLQTSSAMHHYPIDIDTERKVIKLRITGNAGPALNGTDLSGEFYSTMDDSRAVDGILELDYDVLGTSAVILCYDLENSQYVLKGYSQPVSNKLIRIAFIRTNKNMPDAYVDANIPIVTVNNGHPNYSMQKQLEIGELASRYFVKRIWQGNYNSGDGTYTQRKMIIDIANKSVTIPTAEFVYGKQVIQVSEPYTINWTGSTSLLYIFCNLTTGLFEAYGYSDLSKNDVILVKNKMLLYDIVRLPDARGLLTDEIAFVGITKVKYFDVSEILNFANPDVELVPLIRYNSMLSQYAQRINDDDVIMDYCRAGNNGFKDVVAIACKPELNSFHANCAKITKDDNIFALKIDSFFKGKGDYRIRAALRFYAYVDNKFTLVHDTGWYADNASGTNNRQNWIYGNFLKINNIFKEIEANYKMAFDTIYVCGLAQRITPTGTPVNFEDPLVDLKDVHFEIKVLHYNELHNKGELPNTVPYEDVIYKTTTTSPRWNYILPTAIKGIDTIQVSSKIKQYTVDGVKYGVNMSVHYLNDSNATVFDTNWVTSRSQWTSNAMELSANVFNYWDNRYSPNGYPSMLDAITKTAKAEIYVGLDGLPRTLTEDERRDLFTQMDITYEVQPMTNKELEELVIPYEYKENILLSNSIGGANNVAASRIDIETYTASTNIAKIDIVTEAKGFLVEFRAKVSGGIGYIQFVNSINKMSVINTGMKAFKMRFNKSTIAALSGNITVTPPSGGSITIQDLRVVPIFDEVPTSNHNNAQFYLHRGLSGDYPENTLLAVEEACKRGCTVIEVDTFSSTDNKTLICHDETLGRTNKEYPSRSYTDTTKFSMYSTSVIRVDASLISQFALHERLTITDNGSDKTAYINAINKSNNTLTLSISNLTGPISKITSAGVAVSRCSLAEFLQYEVGEYKNAIYKGELNAPLEDYIKVVRRYNAALLLDIRTMTEANFKGEIAELLDKYDYWDKCYFMHGESNCDTYHQWAGEINRKIVIMPITYNTADNLTALLNRYGTKDHPHALRKDIAISNEGITKEHMDLAHSYGIRVHTFTVNSISRAQELLRMGVDIVGGDYFSDDTAILW